MYDVLQCNNLFAEYSADVQYYCPIVYEFILNQFRVYSDGYFPTISMYEQELISAYRDGGDAYLIKWYGVKILQKQPPFLLYITVAILKNELI